MTHLAIDKMWQRIDVARQDADTTLFFDLMYAGEMLTKIVVAGLVAGIANDRERHKYRQLHRLMRADGLGDWAQVLDEVMVGPASQHLQLQARNEQKELTQKNGVGSWQYDAYLRLNSALKVVDPDYEDPPSKVDGRKWFLVFIELRNKTRGHGAPQAGVCGKICKALEDSIRLIIENFTLLRRSWVYLYRNLSGKYRITELSGDSTPFLYLKSTTAGNFPDGIYINFDVPARVDLIFTNVDATDFSFPNGNFRSKTFELLSYITGNRSEADNSAFLTPAGELPASETQGIGGLEIQGQCFGNLPPSTFGYIHRPQLEQELRNVLVDDHHPVVTLVGRGGIGKTSTALAVLHSIAKSDRFAVIIWFSARDIDLLPQGPRIVTPHILTEKDIAREFTALVQPMESSEKGFDPLSYMASVMTKSPFGGSTIFIFDNFETVRNPLDIYNWIDTNIRNPNKVLITTRHREFKADYDLEVSGMTEDQANQLISSTADSLGIRSLLNDEYQRDLFQESDGHPYIIKVLLGEVAKAKKLVRVERIVAGKDELLDALFERTYAGLSPVARRVYLTLCNWRSVIPQVALEAVLIRQENERMDTDRAVEELIRSSFIDLTKSAEDNMAFISVPLVAAVFGRRKLEVSSMKAAVESDTSLLQAFGAVQPTDIRHGIKPRVERLFSYVASRMSQYSTELDRLLPMLEFVARKYYPAWLLIASLHEESGLPSCLERAKDAVRRYLESAPRNSREQFAWDRLAILCQHTSDWVGEINAMVQMCELPGSSFDLISNSANRLNSLFRQNYIVADSEEKRVIVSHLIQIMERRLNEADAVDYSRLAWLCLNFHDENRAIKYTRLGLKDGPHDDHCIKLAIRLGILTEEG